MVDILPMMELNGEMYEAYVTQQQSASTIALKLGITNGTVIKHLRALGVEIRQHQGSDIGRVWLQQIMNLDNIVIEYEFPIKGTPYIVDGYCRANNTIYEFHGDYWHGNPKVHAPNTYNKNCYKTMNELYLDTVRREELLKSLGYNLIVMWESDFYESIKTHPIDLPNKNTTIY